MLPTVFLSLSGHDDKFVDAVHALLPQGLAYFYRKSFATGENLLTAMEERLKVSSIFVLFASRASLTSKWVGFEVDRARLALISRDNFRGIVIPIDDDISHKDLPGWMQEYWTGNAGKTPRDIARYIQGLLAEITESSLVALRPFGRGGLIDQAQREIQIALYERKKAPNVFIFGGHGGIGRRTSSRALMKAAYPAQPALIYGPELVLPQFADVLDLYRSIRRELEADFSQETFERDEAVFNGLPLDDKITEIANSLEHFASLGQAITIVTDNGLFEDKGALKPWVFMLFKSMEDRALMKVICITNRLLHENERRPHSNVLQFRVDELPNVEIKAIIIASEVLYGAEPQLPNDGIIHAIGGHPGVARATARLLAQKGANIINNNPKEVFDVQDEVLTNSLGFERLSEIAKEVLSILSWVQRFSATMMQDIIRTRHGISEIDLAEIVGELIVSCLVQVTGPDYLISPPIRNIFRRKFGYGSVELRTALAARLNEDWAKSQAAGKFSTELFDSFVYMTALEGGSLPKEFGKLVLPATLQEVVKEGYDNRHIDDNGLDRAISWGLPAMNIAMDEPVREEILSYVMRAQTRRNAYVDAGSTLKFMQDRGYRSVYYLEAFLIRLSGGDMKDALDLLRTAKQVKKYANSVVADTAICLKELGRWEDLAKLIESENGKVYRNAVLLDVKIGILIAEGKFREAEDDIEVLRAMAHDDGRADSRQATILMNRDKNHVGAYKLLTKVLAQQSRGNTGVRTLRALVAARGGDAAAARKDTEVLQTRPDGKDIHHRIEAEIKLQQRDYSAAESERMKIEKKTARDELLHARILEVEATDSRTPLHMREELYNKAAIMRKGLRAVDEYDIES